MAGKTPTSLIELLHKVPTKLLITVFLIVLVFTCSLVAYAVIFQNTPVEIFGVIKFGERADDLRRRLVKIQTENESKIAPELYQNALGQLKETESRLKEAESKASLPSPETSQLRKQLKDRDDKIAILTKQLAESTHIVEVLTKDLTDAKAKFKNVNVELQGSQEKFIEVSRQLKDQTKKLDEIVSADIERRRILTGYIRQFEDLEKRSSNTNNEYVELSYTRQFNNVLTALKKDLPKDNYIQNMDSLWLTGTSESFSSSLKSTSARIRAYLEQRYLK